METKRNYFRIDYPPSERPRLVIEGEEFSILNLSEQGLRFEPKGKSFALGSALRGSIRFSDGMSYLVRGLVARTQVGDVVVQLQQGIPLPRMLQEERRLIQRYGKKAS